MDLWLVEVLLFIIDRFYIALFSAFKQKTAYEIVVGLVGSEMCIRDRFESLLERRENFLFQGQLSVLTVISVSVSPRVTAVARKRSRSFC